MNPLKQLLNFVTPEPKTTPLDDNDYFSRQFIRTLTIMGYESYDIYFIAEEMQNKAMNPQDYPDLFTPCQRLQRKVYLSK